MTIDETRRRWAAISGLALSALLVVGMTAAPAPGLQFPASNPWRPAPAAHHALPSEAGGIVDQANLSSADINRSANQLLTSVKQWIREDRDVPGFAKDRIEWLTAQQKAGALSILLLEHIAETNLDFEDLMAAGVVNGVRVIVIAQPRFAGFLIEGARVSAPFGQQQRNDFMLALVHEVVHLQRSNPGNPARFEDRLNEELRAWHDVDLNVVRPLRRLHQPMNETFLRVDEAIRACGDRRECQALRELLLPSEARRQ
jgi:hypothetical protein